MHECVIGLLNADPSVTAVTLEDLEEYIIGTEQYNRNLPKHSQWRRKVVWPLEYYADKRRKTNLHRFAYCPECGQRIDWKSIRRYGDG